MNKVLSVVREGVRLKHDRNIINNKLFGDDRNI